MRIAIIHYHLNQGGVTRVIEGSSQALTAAGIQHVILHGGGVCDAISLDKVVHVPALGYLNSSGEHTADMLLNELRNKATRALGGPPDCWHFHNHSLGKNVLVPTVIKKLVEADERMILQIHDLAEDGRPENFAKIAASLTLYPIAPQIAYVFINSRDRDHFIKAGIPLQQTVLLPNIIDPPKISSCVTRPILFAPIRGIRRKNIGELVLLAALAPEGSLVAVSREPLNPAALHIHQEWQSFAKRLDLPIQFAVTDRLAPATGASSDFASWIAHASHFLCTSVAEGFGLPFLEAIAHGKPLIGRSIPHLNAEQDTGSEWLYDRLLVPAEWISISSLSRHLRAALERNYRSFGRSFSPEIVESIHRLHFSGTHFNFSNLPESFQMSVIDKLSDPISKNRLLVEIAGNREPAVGWLARAVKNQVRLHSPALLEPYSLSHYQERLTTLYQKLIRQKIGPVHYLSSSKILDAYLTPATFHFLCSSPPKIPFFAARFRAVVFDIYGTLLIAPKTGVKVDHKADPILKVILESSGYCSPTSPSTALYQAVQRHHATSTAEYPEIDLCQLWREILRLDSTIDLSSLVEELESSWHPCEPIPGSRALMEHLAESGIALGLLSNAQSNTLSSLGLLAPYFHPDLTVLSYQHGIAKPSPALFQTLASRLADAGISPQKTLFVGNDPLQDILPAQAVGFKTALFIGHPDSLRQGECSPDYLIHDLLELIS